MTNDSASSSGAIDYRSPGRCCRGSGRQDLVALSHGGLQCRTARLVLSRRAPSHAIADTVPAEQLDRLPNRLFLARRSLAARVIGLHFRFVERAVAILVRLLHDLVRDPMCAPRPSRFLFRHDSVAISIALFEISRARSVPARPFFLRHAPVMIRIARVEDFVDQEIAGLIARQFSIMIRVLPRRIRPRPSSLSPVPAADSCLMCMR